MVSMESGAEFRYLLHGVTPEWSAWTDRDLFIRALPAGDYALEVQARTLTGRQPPSMIYRFRVLPRWYEQWWAIALGLLAVAGLASGLTVWSVRRRTERYLLENRRLEARIAERTHELEELNRRLAELVTEDALTGVANRRALENGLRREWYRCLDQRRPLSVLMIDVDHFKAYNDAHGHLEGDVQLRRIAQRLAAEHDPQRELLSRYGGEEFALLLPGVHREEAARRAEQIRAAISASDIGMTVSIGVAASSRTCRRIRRACCAGPMPRSTRPSAVAATASRPTPAEPAGCRPCRPRQASDLRETGGPVAGPPACAFRSGFLDQADDGQQDHRADEGGDEGADGTTHGQAELRQQPAAEEGADHADDDVDEDAEAASLHHHAGEPAGEGADDQEDDQVHVDLQGREQGKTALRPPGRPAAAPCRRRSTSWSAPARGCGAVPPG
jgi:diguanylate cyclase (GGDEF)-like protein